MSGVTNANQKRESILKRTPPYRQENRDKVPRIAADRRNQLAKSNSLSVAYLKLKVNECGESFILWDVDFSTSSKGLTVITGSVGSRKSSLLQALAAGEESIVFGTRTSPYSLVYVPQTPWVFFGTIRENILFDEPYHKTMYSEVVDACALVEDIQTFPNGDQTVVGERGVLLSGGQRVRVSFAVYEDANLYLLDDPLSAVDRKVGQHIFEKCIKDILGNKTRVLTPHQERHMKGADEVIVMHKGSV